MRGVLGRCNWLWYSSWTDSMTGEFAASFTDTLGGILVAGGKLIGSPHGTLGAVGDILDASTVGSALGEPGGALVDFYE